MAIKHVTALHSPNVVAYRHSLRQPAQLLALHLEPLAVNVPWPQVDAWLADRLDVTVTECPDIPGLMVTNADAYAVAPWFWRVLLVASALLRIGGVPIFEPGRLLRLYAAADSSGVWHAEAAVAQVDYVAEHWFIRSYEAASIIISGLAHYPDDFADTEPLYRQLESQLIGPMWSANSSTHSNLALLQAAYAADIPWRHQGHGIYQLGWGRYLHRIQSGQLDADSPLGQQVSRNKHITAQWLKRAGLPTASHLLVNDENSAVQAAQQLGGTLVIKPADSVGGQGVTLNVSTPAQVRMAYAKATAVSRQVLVEQQVAGLVHHIQVACGKIVYVLRRQPVAVQGDGKHTVTELVTAQNAERQRVMLWRRAPPLPLDTLAIECLKYAGYTPDSLPPAGVWLPLRNIATNADGGRDDDVMHLLHPDNAALALRAARLLGLGLAGVDIISADISVPWHVNGAIINEVNNTPMLGIGETSRAAVPKIIAQLIAGKGRIPVEVFIGGSEALIRARGRQQALVSQGVNCFLSSHDITEDAQGHNLPMSCHGAFYRTRALLMDKRVGAIAIVLQTDEWLETGLPVDRIAHLEVMDGILSCVNGMPATPDRMSQLLTMLRQHITDNKQQEHGG